MNLDNDSVVLCDLDHYCVLGDLGCLICTVWAALRPVHNRSRQGPHRSTGELKQDPTQSSFMIRKESPHQLFLVLSFCRCFVTSAWHCLPSSWWSWALSCMRIGSSFSTTSLKCLMRLSWSCPSSWISSTSPKKTPSMPRVCSSCSGCGGWPGSLTVWLTYSSGKFLF